MHEVIALEDPIWRDAYLIGGETRVTELAVECLLSAKRIHATEGMFTIRKGDHLAPEESIQRVVLNVIAQELRADLPTVAKAVAKTAPIVAIKEELVAAGLMKQFLGRTKLTAAGQERVTEVVAAHRSAEGLRGTAYAS